MSVRQIVFSNEPQLHEASGRVKRVDDDLEELVEDLIETMRAADGIGLAAVQIGVPEQVIVVEVPIVSETEEAEEGEAAPGEPVETELYVLINPELVNASEELEEAVEGCLSIPGWAGEVERHRTVTVEALDRAGQEVRIRAEGLLARVLQHEIDHCQGVLFIDRIDDPDKIWRVEEAAASPTEEQGSRGQR